MPARQAGSGTSEGLKTSGGGSDVGCSAVLGDLVSAREGSKDLGEGGLGERLHLSVIPVLDGMGR